MSEDSGDGKRGEGRKGDTRGQDREQGREPAENDSAALDPDEMTLEQLRQEIHDIDREIVELIARRTYVADTIAEVKADKGLPTVDEQQETRVMERAGANAERFDVEANLVKAIFRLLIELNKVEQRERR